MIHTFGKVIGISIGIVAVVFLIVATILYRSGSDAIPQERPQALSRADSSLIPPSQPAVAPRNPEVVLRQSPAEQRPSVRTQNTPKPVRTASSVQTVARSGEGVQTSSKNAGRMTPEEYVEREMYYINKIGQESEQVLQRSAEEYTKLESYKAELEALQNPIENR